MKVFLQGKANMGYNFDHQKRTTMGNKNYVNQTYCPFRQVYITSSLQHLVYNEHCIVAI